MTPILLYSHCNEPITQVLSSVLDQKCGLIKLPLKALLDDVIIVDEINQDEIKLTWTLPSGLTIS